MNKKPSFYVSLVFTLLTFSLNVVYIAYLKLNNYVISPDDFIFKLIISAFVVSVIITAIKKIPSAVKIIFTVLIFCITAFASLWLNGVGGNTYFKVYKGIDGINAYNETIGENHVVYYDDEINAEDYGEFEDITCYDYVSTGIFQQLSVTVIVKYDDLNFEKEVKRINEEYDFYKKAVIEDEPDPVFTFEGFDFRLVKGDYATYWYPKDLNFIGINDATNEIAYVSFQDDDLDGVWEFEDLLYSYAGWYYITEEWEKNNR